MRPPKQQVICQSFRDGGLQVIEGLLQLASVCVLNLPTSKQNIDPQSCSFCILVAGLSGGLIQLVPGS